MVAPTTSTSSKELQATDQNNKTIKRFKGDTMQQTTTSTCLFAFSSALLILAAIIIGVQFPQRNNKSYMYAERKTSEIEDGMLLHNQCSRGNPSALSNRPLLLLKYARTGSTWLAWTGQRLVASGLPMTWVHEAQKCSKAMSGEQLSTWMAEFLSRTTNGTMNGRDVKHTHTIDHTCLRTVGKDPSELGVMVVTLAPHVLHDDTPNFTPEEWSKIFEASPDLAVGALVRTNSVKHAISGIASHVQREICHSKKLHGDEDCIKLLPKTLHIEPEELMDKIRESEMIRTIAVERAAELSSQYGDGRIFCLSYEAMQEDMVGEIKDLGDYLGAPIDPASLAELKEGGVSYKRGSDDLSTYMENYEEIRNVFASENPCLLEQLDATEPRTFPLCGVYVEDDVEDEQ